MLEPGILGHGGAVTADELRPVHARHVVVDDDNLGRYFDRDQFLERDLGIAIGLGAMAQMFQQAAKAIAHEIVVVDDIDEEMGLGRLTF